MIMRLERVDAAVHLMARSNAVIKEETIIKNRANPKDARHNDPTTQ